MADLKTVQVALRVRPISQAELTRGNDSVVKVIGRNEVIVGDGKLNSERFTFNHTFNPNTTQLELYEQAVVDLLEKLFEGYNVTILAYGQTCSGKTYTMGTEFKGELSDDVGVIPRAVTDIFRVIETSASEGSATTRVSCSFIELYQETVYDLLSVNRQSIEIREAAGEIVLQGLTKVPVDSVQATLDCLRRGAIVRCVGSTAMNEVSSRSHAIFTINIQKVSPDDPQSVVQSKFHLVDLAGSERSKKTQATGDRFKEGVKINQGLLALGNVISALGSLATGGSTGSVHVPYRDSKLTRLLQDSLGGNSFTLMIACISPVDYNREETLSTLRYADRACKIKNKPIVNVDPQRARIIQLEATIAELRQTIAQLRGLEGDEVEKNNRSPETYGKSASSGSILNDARLLQLEEKNRILLDRMQSMLPHLATKEMRALAAEKALEDIEAKLELQAAEEGEEDGEQDESGSTRACVDQIRPRTMDFLKSVVGETLVSYRQERNRLQLPAADTRESVGSEADADSQVSQSEAMLQASDSHTQQQLRMYNELNELNSMLAVKEQLVRRFLGQGDAESSVVATRTCQLRAQLEEQENTIRALEEQLAVQNEQLKSTKASDKTSKLAEERRRKVRQLETELATLRQRAVAMQNHLKQKEKDCLRVPGLTAEIKAMKAARVQLLKTMRAEQEKFRQWQQTQQKQICQLEAKDRKRQQAIQKMESMHALQKQVILRRMDVEKKALQRKMDETAAVNRRLKAALERRKPTAGGGGPGADRSNLRGAEAMHWIDQELELLHSAVEATEMLKLLEQQRDEESVQLAVMKAEASEESAQNVKNGQSVGDLQRERIANFEASLRVRNETIVDLEQKLRSVNMDEQLATLSSTLATLPETREVMRRLLDVLVQKDVVFIRERFTKMEAQCKQTVAKTPVADRKQLSTLTLIKNMDPEEQYRQLLQRYKLQQQCHSDRTEATGGEDELIALTEHVLADSSTLRDELNLFKASYKLLQAQVDELRANGASRQPVFKKPKLSKVNEDILDDDLDEGEEYFLEEESAEDLERDPTFRMTPLAKRKKPEPVVPSTNDSSSSSATTSAQQLNTTVAHCSCAGTCSTKRCGCRKNNIACSSTCKCPENCVNQDNQENQSVTQEEEPKQKEGEPEGAAPVAKRPMDQHLDILEYVRQNKKRKPLIDL